jgi:Zn-dependent protease/CBS domain-containing protein
MAWSFSVGRIFGIDLRLHVTFFLVLIFAGSLVGPGYGFMGYAFGAVLVMLLFSCVAMHELGHALAARFAGQRVRQVVLLPIGGVAQVEGQPRKPWQEMGVALAGPMVNFFLALLLSAVLTPMLGLLEADPAQALKAYQAVLQGKPGMPMALAWLLTANLWLLLFNLIPAFPMDGGRILRGGLSLFMKHGPATSIAVWVGQGLALMMAFWGIKNGSMAMVAVAVFVFFGAGQEKAEAFAKVVLDTLKVGEAYNKAAITLSPADPIGKAVQLILTSGQRDFAVVYEGRLEGVATRDAILKSLVGSGEDTYVSATMKRQVAEVDHELTLEAVRQILQQKQERLAAIYKEGAFLGLVSLEDIDEAMLVAAHLKMAREAREKDGV